MDRSDDFLTRVRDVLERAIGLLEEGVSPDSVDLTALCGGDPALERAARDLLEGEESFVDTLRAARAPSRAGAELEPGVVLGDFEVVARLGSGGMGTVYLARQRSLDRMVALKVIDPLVADAARFRREATISAALDHPNIVPVHAVGEADGMSYLAMKWLTGPGLDRAETPMAPARVAEIGAALARALEETHASGIVHRDIKPANVILDDGVPYLVDFGLARSQRDASLTARGAFLGTLEYVAPEQISRGVAGVSGRSDIYSLGATLYELAAGRRCFDATDREQLVHEILTREPPRPGLASADRDLETILLRALDKDPERRFATAGELADDLERFGRGEPIRSRPLGPIARAARLARRHRTATGLVAGLVVVLVVTGGFLAADRRAEAHRLDVAILDAEHALERDAPVEAAAIVRSLQRAGDERVTALERKIEAREALLLLLDRVQRGTEQLDPDELRDLAARVESLGSADERPRETGVAQTLAAYHLGDRDGAIARLDALEVELGRSRATRALRGLVEDGAPVELPRERGESAADHVFAAVALRRAGAALDAVRFEVESARALDDVHHRAQILEGLLLLDEGRIEEALAAFRALPRPGRLNDEVHRTRMLLELSLGRLDEARASLDRIPEERRTALDRYHHYQLLWSRGDLDALRAALAERGGEAGSADPLQLLTEARLAEVEGRFDDAHAAFTGVPERTSWHQLTDEAEAGRLRVEYRRLSPESAGAVDTPGLEALLAEARAAVDRLRYPLARASALWVEGSVARDLGRPAAALDAFRRSVIAEPDAPAARLEFAGLANGLLAAELEHADEAVATRPAVDEARELLRPLLDPASGKRVFASPVAVLDAWRQELLLAAQLAEWDAFAEASRRAHEFARARLPERVAGFESELRGYRPWLVGKLAGGGLVESDEIAAAVRTLDGLLTDS